MSIATIRTISPGVVLKDINTEQSENIAMVLYQPSTSYVPIQGYKKISAKTFSGRNVTMSFCDINKTQIESSISVTTSWMSYVDIPKDAIYVCFNATGSTNSCPINYSLKA